MADENDKPKQDKLNNFDDETTSENTQSTNTDNFLEDDEAIDQLLMDEMFGTSEAEQGADDLVEIDEFAEDEKDELSENSDSISLISEEINQSPESNQSEVESDDNDYLDDFDITADDDESLVDEIENDELAQPETQGGFKSEAVQEALTTHTGEDLGKTSVGQEKPNADNTVIAEALTAQVSQLWAELSDVKEQIPSDLPSDSTEDIEQINTKLKRISRDQEKADKRNKLLSSIAIAIAVLGAIFGIIALIQNGRLDNEVNDLMAEVSDMEESATEPDYNTQKTLSSLKDSYLLLDNNQQSIRNQLAQLKDQLSSEISKSDQNQPELQETVSILQQQISEFNSKIDNLSNSIKKLQARKPKKPTKTVRKKKSKPSADWTVNLVSFKQEWYAKKKAAEFKNKGIPVEVVPVKVKGEQWYRLRVTGFKTKYEAGSYASRAKKALNLSSVWVTQK